MVEPLTSKQKSAIERAKGNPDLLRILLRKAVGLNWFNPFIEAGFVDPSEIPPPESAKEEGFVSIPTWPITDYLVSTSEELIKPHNVDFAHQFLDFIRDSTTYAKAHGICNYRVWWQFSKILQNIPNHLIKIEDLSLAEYWLDDLYDRGLVAESLGKHWFIKMLDHEDEHCKALSIKLLEILFKINIDEMMQEAPGIEKATFRFNSWHAKELAKYIAEPAGRVLGLGAVEFFQNQLENMLTTLNNDKWSSIWRPAIEDHEQNHHTRDVLDIIVEAFRNALLGYIEASPASAYKYVELILNGPFETMRRIAILVIDQRFDQLRELLGRVIVDQHFGSNFRHEMWQLLHNHFQVFFEEEKTFVTSAIKRIVKSDENNQPSESSTAYTRAIWLSAIKDCDTDAAKLYADYIGIISGEPEHPDFSSYRTVTWVDHKSPISQETILSLSIEDLINKLDTFEAGSGYDEPSVEGFGRSLRQAIKSEPTKFSGHLSKFLPLDLVYTYELIEAYSELWTEKSNQPWDQIWTNLLNFFESVSLQDLSLSTEDDQYTNTLISNRRRVVGSIGQLIENGTKSDEHAFSKKHLKQAQAIILALLENTKGDEFELSSDAVSKAINSPRGRCIEALINLTLRSCRLADRDTGQHSQTWNVFQPIYEDELAKAKEEEFEFSTLIVNYLPNFLYMSNEWTLTNLDNIFNHNIYQQWLCAMQGYTYVTTVYEAIYNHLKEKGDFIRALDDKIIKEDVSERIVQNIAVAYINDFEKLDDKSSLLQHILNRNNFQEISHLVWFLWAQHKDADMKLSDKITALWGCILMNIDTGTREGRLIASKLCDWSIFIDKINNENKQLILTVAPYAEEDYNSHELLDTIARISEKQPIEAYEIWSTLLKDAKPIYPEEAIKAGLNNLVAAGTTGIRLAKEIASEYIRGGNEQPMQWLSDITNK